MAISNLQIRAQTCGFVPLSTNATRSGTKNVYNKRGKIDPVGLLVVSRTIWLLVEIWSKLLLYWSQLVEVVQRRMNNLRSSPLVILGLLYLDTVEVRRSSRLEPTI